MIRISSSAPRALRGRLETFILRLTDEEKATLLALCSERGLRPLVRDYLEEHGLARRGAYFLTTGKRTAP